MKEDLPLKDYKVLLVQFVKHYLMTKAQAFIVDLKDEFLKQF